MQSKAQQPAVSNTSSVEGLAEVSSLAMGNPATSSGKPQPPNSAEIGSFPASFWLITSAMAVLFTWSYAPTLKYFAERWTQVADYSHGFLVIPIAVYLLWARRETLPPRRPAYLPGLFLVILAELIRVASARAYLTSLDGWSISVWLGGVCLLFGGWRLVLWCWPSLAFLFFMVPLPYRAETLLSLPLQRVSCAISTWVLQFLGQPAILEGNTVLINDIHLEVSKACSGSRIFMSIAAIAFIYCILIRSPWWTKLSVLCSVVPIALLANSIRIAGTGLLNVFFSDSVARSFNHEAAGWLMLPVAAAMMAAVVWYVGRLLQEEKALTVRQSLGRGVRPTV